ncbi:MAG: phosphoribosylanthranilate isomerase [Bacteroidales bacterium]|nr:phosphoribosylanthranilate isomerase [Bacteroidales bacterium]
MNDPESIRSLAALRLDLMGFIFWSGTARSALQLDPAVLDELPVSMGRVGVFVNEDYKTILPVTGNYGLSHVQLHGQESPELCERVRSTGLKVIKAFPIAGAEDLNAVASYEGCCDYYLFDTKSLLPGGSGMQYDWSLLEHYKGTTPFLLSGGIAPQDAKRILQFRHPQFAGIDINSRFETAPGVKDVSLIRQFIKEINQQSKENE